MSNQTFKRVVCRFAFVCVLASMVVSCFPTDWYEPVFEDKEEFHNLTIPSEGGHYIIPFEFKWYCTRTSRPMKTYQIRYRMIINDIAGEICDAGTPQNRGLVDWSWSYDVESTPDVQPAVFLVKIPANDTSEERKIAVQISIDNIANDSFSIEEDDEHDWGEWITILDGTQFAGK